MKVTEAMEVELEKQRIIKFAASMGIKLTVLDRPSQITEIPEKYREVQHNNVKPNKS